MGDMVDYSISQGGGWGIDAPGSRPPPVSTYRKKRTTCNYCGSTAVRWENRSGTWILTGTATNRSHSCPEYDRKDGAQWPTQNCSGKSTSSL